MGPTSFPTLRREMEDQITLKDIDPDDRELFQKFTDTVNDLLDHHFISVKEILYPGVWKLGVGIIHADAERLFYQIYGIPYKEPAPLVCKLRGSLHQADRKKRYPFAEHLSSREFLSHPESAGTDFVTSRVERIVEDRALPVFGEMSATDVLFHFVDKYHRCLGLERTSHTLRVSDLNYALNVHLLGVCAAFISENISPNEGFVHLDLDWVSQYVKDRDVSPIAPGENPIRFSIGSKRVSVRLVYDSLRYLLGNNIQSITRPFPLPDVPNSPGGHWIWEGFSREAETESVKRILTNSLNEYSQFVQGNRLNFPNSPYLDSQTAILFQYEPAKSLADSLRGEPVLREYHLENPLKRLPKLSVSVGEGQERVTGEIVRSSITIDGHQYQLIQWSDGFATFLFQETPVLRLIYRMLTQDLSRHYGITTLRSYRL